jgi:hypothetical protein
VTSTTDLETKWSHADRRALLVCRAAILDHMNLTEDGVADELAVIQRRIDQLEGKTS